MFQWTKRSIEDMVWLTLEGENAESIAAHLGCIQRTIRDMQIELGLVTALKKKSWIQSELDELAKLYADGDTLELATKFGCSLSSIFNASHKLGLRKSKEYTSAIGRKYLAPAGRSTRFRPGQIPVNKGVKRPGWAPGRMAETQFKKGERSGIAATNWRPIGTILPDTEGFLRIKVREGKKGEPYGFGNTKIWPLLNRHVWEQHKGPIPPHHAVVFRNGNRADCEIDNLELVSRAELMRRNSVHNLPKQLVEVIRLGGALKRVLRRKSEEHNDRFAKPLVRDAGDAEGRREADGY